MQFWKWYTRQSDNSSQVRSYHKYRNKNNVFDNDDDNDDADDGGGGDDDYNDDDMIMGKL